MAGDWIKMRTNLDTDPRVCEIAAQLNMTELHVVGCLWKLWSWADEHTVDGNAVRVTKLTLDRFVCVSGFADALRNVGWLEGRDSALTFPRFSEHNGQTAKTRALTAKRVAKHKVSGERKGNASLTVDALPREEKRREEKSIKKTNNASDLVSPFFEDQEFSKLFEVFCESSRVNHSWNIAQSTMQAWLYSLNDLGIADAKDALRFSTSAGAKKPIINGDHRPKPAASKRRSRADAELTEEDLNNAAK